MALKKIGFFVVILSGLFLNGCSMFLDTSPNYRRFVKDQIKSDAWLRAGEPVKYEPAKIGYPYDTEIDFTKLTGIIIEFPTGKIPLSKLTPDMLFSQNCHLSLNPLSPYGGLDAFSESEDVFGVQVCSGNNKYNFMATKKKIIQISLNGCLWNENMTKQYSSPMDYDELVELFGEPDGEYDWFVW